MKQYLNPVKGFINKLICDDQRATQIEKIDSLELIISYKEASWLAFTCWN